MKKSKLFVALLAAVALLASLAACSVTAVESISFNQAPKGVYALNESVYAKDFTLTIKYEGNKTRTVSLTDSVLAVTGLVDGKLDTSSLGQKTVSVTYRGVTVTVYYTVASSTGGTVTPADSFAGGTGTQADPYQIATAEQLAAVKSGTADNPTYYKLTDDINLGEYNWAPLTANYIVLDGKNGEANFEIQGLSITSATEKNSFGLFRSLANSTVSNLTFTGAYIDMTSTEKGESCKNVGVVVAEMGANSEVSNVTVDGAFLRGNGRVAGIAGQVISGGSGTIENCTVKNTRIVANNPVSVAAADGEGDKVGGILGQNQGTVTITGCTVGNTILSATRDLGGIIGMSVTGTISDNRVVGCTISASVPGGVREDVGTRNVGGILGTIMAGTVTWSNNTVTDTTITPNSLYEKSSSGDYIGGIRRDRKAKTTLTVGDRPLDIDMHTGTESEGTTAFDEFMTWQTAEMVKINALITGAAVTE